VIRARFHANEYDFRPIVWPVKHPYWCTGYGDGYSIIVAYADNEAEILTNWPEATNIEWTKEESYFFSDRFMKPEWFKEQA